MQPSNPAQSPYSTKGLKQVGWCESCGEPAYSTRHGEVIVIETNDDGSFKSSHSEPTEHYMCMRHKSYYLHYMAEQRRKLIERQNKRRENESDSHYRHRIDRILNAPKGTM